MNLKFFYPEIFYLIYYAICVMENRKKTGKSFQDTGKSIWGLESPSSKAIGYNYLQLLIKKKRAYD